jgi:hypothetical protein
LIWINPIERLICVEGFFELAHPFGPGATNPDRVDSHTLRSACGARPDCSPKRTPPCEVRHLSDTEGWRAL